MILIKYPKRKSYHNNNINKYFCFCLYFIIYLNEISLNIKFLKINLILKIIRLKYKI